MSIRYDTTYTEGVESSGAGSVEALYDSIVATILAYSFGGSNPWTEVSEVATRDKVLYSGGDPSSPDIACWLRITHSGNNINVIMYQDWSSLSETGSKATTLKTIFTGNNTTGGSVNWYMVVNAYEIGLIAVQDANEWIASMGVGMRYGSNRGLIGRTTASVGSGSGVVVPVDRDLELVDGQQIWIYNVTPDGLALRADTINITTVDASDATSVTMNTLANSFDAGAIIGLHPSCNYVAAASGVGTMQGRAIYSADGTSPVLILQTYSITSNLFDETEVDPNIITDAYYGTRIVMNENTISAQTYGVMQHVIACSQDGFTIAEKIQAELEDDTIYRAHRGSPTGHTTMALLLGPGAAP